jgi:hypothetical protein
MKNIKISVLIIIVNSVENERTLEHDEDLTGRDAIRISLDCEMRCDASIEYFQSD